MSPTTAEKSTKPSVETEAKKQAALHCFEGKVVSISGSRLESVNREGLECSYTMTPNAWLTWDGEICQLADLAVGRRIRVTIRTDDQNVVTAIERLDGDERESTPKTFEGNVVSLAGDKC